MTEQQLKMIEEIVRSETDIKQLNDLKCFINNEVKRKVEEMNVPKDSDDVLTPSQIVVLLSNFRDFVSNNLHPKIKWRGILYGIMEKEKIDRDSVKVYHMIKLGPNRLLNMRNVGEYSLATFEQVLNKFDLSLYKPLTDKQIQKLEKIDKDSSSISNYVPFNGNISFTDEQVDILLESLMDFTDKNIPKYTYYRAIMYAIMRDYSKEEFCRFSQIKMYHVIDFGERKLLSSPTVGPATISRYEEALNKYGLSLRRSIPADEFELLKKEEAKRQKIKKSS